MSWAGDVPQHPGLPPCQQQPWAPAVTPKCLQTLPKCPQGNNIAPHRRPHLRTTELVNYQKWGWKEWIWGPYQTAGVYPEQQSLQGAVGRSPPWEIQETHRAKQDPRSQDKHLAGIRCQPVLSPCLQKCHPPQLGDLST